MLFLSELPKILEALEVVSKWNEYATIPKAKNLLTVTVLQYTQFVVSLQSLLNNFSTTSPLQKKTSDLCAAYSQNADLLYTLEQRFPNFFFS